MNMREFSLQKEDEIILELTKNIKRNSKEHKALVLWSLDCINRVLPMFEQKYPNDHKMIVNPAIHLVNDWLKDKLTPWSLSNAQGYARDVTFFARNLDKDYPPHKKADTGNSQIVEAVANSLRVLENPIYAERVSAHIINSIKHLNDGKKNTIELMEKEREWQINHLKELKNNIQLENKEGYIR